MSADYRWWRDGVIYQIYPRSFADSNGDGIGDIPGIVGKLDYLAGLGIAGIWLSPINTSPMYDFGYDVSNYRGIDPLFGTDEDFAELIDQAHARGIRIIMDIVMNHTSYLHPWFGESRSSRESPKRDWYIWHDGRGAGDGRPGLPNNWLSIFGGKAWEWDEQTRAYYLHSFVTEQPDLNWYNPEVRDAAYDELRYWLDRGVDGFRFDVINWFGHDREFRSNPFRMSFIPRAYEFQHHVHDRNHPVSREIAGDIRELLDAYDERAMICEVYSEPPGDPELSGSYAGPGLSHMAFDFSLIYRKWDAAEFFRVIQTWDETMKARDAWPCYVLSNHDRHRTRSRLGSDSYKKAKVAATLLLTLRGTPYIYYGEELGMEDCRIPHRMIQDPVGKRYWPLEPGRDPVRTPMQWDASASAGFTTGTPWLPVHENRDRINVEAESADPDSLLSLHRRLIALRNGSPALQHGEWTPVQDGARGVIAYIRETASERKLVALNFRGRAATVDPPAPGQKEHALLTVDLSTHQRPAETPGTSGIHLAPYEAAIFTMSAK
jgi:alpha-glucosidase